MKAHAHKIASVLAAVIGGMAVFAGGKVLLGIDPGYYVVNWVPVYNYTMGLLTVFITAVLMWRNSKYALPLAVGTLSAHALVMVILQTAFRDAVASESIQAMTVRIVVWTVILLVLLVPSLAFTKVRTARGREQS